MQRQRAPWVAVGRAFCFRDARVKALGFIEPFPLAKLSLQRARGGLYYLF